MPCRQFGSRLLWPKDLRVRILNFRRTGIPIGLGPKRRAAGGLWPIVWAAPAVFFWPLLDHVEGQGRSTHLDPRPMKAEARRDLFLESRRQRFRMGGTARGRKKPVAESFQVAGKLRSGAVCTTLRPANPGLCRASGRPAPPGRGARR